jgi:small subunit ribosomal protein S17
MSETTETTTANEPDAVAAPATGHGQVPRGRHNGRKVREGVVSSTKMDKTVIVTIVSRVRHPLYRKTLQRTSKLYVHDEGNEAREGDRVRVRETRPLSKLKRWRLLEIVERAK